MTKTVTIPWYSNGLRHVAPVVLGFLPVAFAFGVLARKAGLSVEHALGMSVFVFAGSAQLVAVAMIMQQASLWAVVVMTFIVNLRHLLMSASLAPYLKSWKPLQVALMTYELTDETFVLHANRFSEQDNDKRTTFLINGCAHLSWIIGTLAGAISGQAITNTQSIGLDFALPAMFIALLAMQLKSRLHILIALGAALFSLLFGSVGLEQWSVIAGTILAATIGLWVKICKTKN